MCCCCCRCGQGQQTSATGNAQVEGSSDGVSKSFGSAGDALDAAKKAIEEAQAAANRRHESIVAYHRVAHGKDKDEAKAALDAAKTQLDAVQAVHAAILQATGATIVHNSVIERSGIIPPQ